MIHYIADIIKIGSPSDLGLPEVSIDAGIGGILKLVFLLLSIAAIIWIVLFGALPYVLSGGESGTIKKAKDTIVYAVIGLVVALISFAIVSFVTSRVH